MRWPSGNDWRRRTVNLPARNSSAYGTKDNCLKSALISLDACHFRSFGSGVPYHMMGCE